MRTFPYTAACLLILSCAATKPKAQTDDQLQIYPPELYPGYNIITITSAYGLRDIKASCPRLIQVEGDGAVKECAKTQSMDILVNTASQPAVLKLLVTDCRGKELTMDISINTQWTLDRISFGTVELEETVCQEFQIRAAGGVGGISMGGGILLDSITVNVAPEYSASLRLPTVLPYHIRPNEAYVYKVCFTPHKAGTYKFPVITWIHRQFPVGPLTAYLISDTGMAIAVPPRLLHH